MRTKGRKHRGRTVSFATWNVCTLMESAGGDRRICRSRLRSGPSPQTPANSNSPYCVDRKLDFLVKEMKRHSVAVAGIQERKWFGKDVWNADGYTLLHSGRPRPDEGEPQVQNEGVGILLGKYATVAWKDAGENWEAISSRVAMARLEVVRWRRIGRNGQLSASSATPLTESSVQPTAPTRTAYIYARVGVPFGFKGTSHGTAGSVMAHNNRATDKQSPPFNACAGEPSAGKQTLPDILDSVIPRDVSFGHYIRGTSCPRIPLSSTRWAAKG